MITQCLMELLLGFYLCFTGDAAGVDNDQIPGAGKLAQQAVAFVLIKFTSEIY
jgi:hypothetical protein